MAVCSEHTNTFESSALEQSSTGNQGSKIVLNVQVECLEDVLESWSDVRAL